MNYSEPTAGEATKERIYLEGYPDSSWIQESADYEDLCSVCRRKYIE